MFTLSSCLQTLLRRRYLSRHLGTLALFERRRSVNVAWEKLFFLVYAVVVWLASSPFVAIPLLHVVQIFFFTCGGCNRVPHPFHYCQFPALGRSFIVSSLHHFLLLPSLRSFSICLLAVLELWCLCSFVL